MTSTLKIHRAWAMPSGDTFTIKPIAKLLGRWLEPHYFSIDPFARNSKIATRTNDLSHNTDAECHMEARDFLRSYHQSLKLVDAVLLDPPYSPRQIRDCYQGIGMPVGQCETQHAKLISEVKDLVAPIVRVGGIVITCAWNSMGMGKNRGFKLREILMVAHGGSHNDTIVTVEEKATNLLADDRPNPHYRQYLISRPATITRSHVGAKHRFTAVLSNSAEIHVVASSIGDAYRGAAKLASLVGACVRRVMR